MCGPQVEDRSRSCGEEVALRSLKVVLRSLLRCAVVVGIGCCDAVVGIAAVAGDIAVVGSRMACSRCGPITMVLVYMSVVYRTVDLPSQH